MPVKVPVTPEPCAIPSFHLQSNCNNDVPCLLTEFALTLQAEHAVSDALLTCPGVKFRINP